jgi:protein CpxP
VASFPVSESKPHFVKLCKDWPSFVFYRNFWLIIPFIDVVRFDSKEISMLKKHLLVLAAAGLISIAAPFAAAQDSQSNDQQSAPSQDNGGRHHGPPDPAQRTAELTKQLNLTSDQQPKVLAALQSQRSQMESLRQDTSLSQQDRHAKMMEIHKATDAQIRGLLDSDQQKKWDEMQARREQRMQNRGGSDQQGPPPPQ